MKICFPASQNFSPSNASDPTCTCLDLDGSKDTKLASKENIRKPSGLDISGSQRSHSNISFLSNQVRLLLKHSGFLAIFSGGKLWGYVAAVAQRGDLDTRLGFKGPPILLVCPLE
ncbi:hypothetical protein JCM33374_g355 [Metschnikowia sp. JCM 33374]|nr:hypothetical protein JCM33374_g355 [Metschnikowia sp. JCM 33374]